jgi:hypothetical protein
MKNKDSKVKLSPSRAHRTVEVYLHAFSTLAPDTLSAKIHILTASALVNSPQYSLNRRLGRPQCSMDDSIKKKKSLAPAGNPTTFPWPSSP